jgi:hypothetical protein
MYTVEKFTNKYLYALSTHTITLIKEAGKWNPKQRWFRNAALVSVTWPEFKEFQKYPHQYLCSYREQKNTSTTTSSSL